MAAANAQRALEKGSTPHVLIDHTVKVRINLRKMRNNTTWVVVLGDFGRSPRMQYHAVSLSEQVVPLTRLKSDCSLQSLADLYACLSPG